MTVNLINNRKPKPRMALRLRCHFQAFLALSYPVVAIPVVLASWRDAFQTQWAFVAVLAVGLGSEP